MGWCICGDDPIDIDNKSSTAAYGSSPGVAREDAATVRIKVRAVMRAHESQLTRIQIGHKAREFLAHLVEQPSRRLATQIRRREAERSPKGVAEMRVASKAQVEGQHRQVCPPIGYHSL